MVGLGGPGAPHHFEILRRADTGTLVVSNLNAQSTPMSEFEDLIVMMIRFLVDAAGVHP